MLSFIPLIVSLWLSFSSATPAPAPPCLVKVPELFGAYEGECKRGKAHGTGTAEGTDQYTGTWKWGYPDGEGVYTYVDGRVYAGEMKKGLREGKGSLAQDDSVLQAGY